MKYVDPNGETGYYYRLVLNDDGSVNSFTKSDHEETFGLWHWVGLNWYTVKLDDKSYGFCSEAQMMSFVENPVQRNHKIKEGSTEEKQARRRQETEDLIVGGFETGAVFKYALSRRDARLTSQSSSNTPLTGGALRANKYSNDWSNGSLKDAIKQFAPGTEGTLNAKGTKMLYQNNETGIQVVHDLSGNYFRIQNTTLLGKATYLDLNGTRPVNTVVDGKTIGTSPSEYKRITHFNNIDK